MVETFEIEVSLQEYEETSKTSKQGHSTDLPAESTDGGCSVTGIRNNKSV